MTWFGNYDHNRWKAAVDACEAFFKEVNAQGHYRLGANIGCGPSRISSGIP